MRPVGLAALLLAGLLSLGACASRPSATPDIPGRAAGPPPARIAAIPLSGPGALVGRGEDEVRAAMGMPKLIRRDRQAQVWQYASARCVLDVYIYSDKGAALVTYVALRDRDGKPADPACFAEVRREGAVSAS